MVAVDISLTCATMETSNNFASGLLRTELTGVAQWTLTGDFGAIF